MPAMKTLPTNAIAWIWPIAVILCMIAPVGAAVQLQFDYTYDTTGFFDAETSDGELARSTLEAVGDFTTDGTGDADDAALLGANWLSGSGSVAASIPAPSVAALLLSALVAAGVFSRRLKAGRQTTIHPTLAC